MPDRRRQRQQRIRHEAGGVQNVVGASNREPEPSKPADDQSQRKSGSGVAYAEPKQYESVTIMPDKEVAEPQKYSRKGIFSNWSRYEEAPTDELEDGEDYMIGEDFSQILEQQGGGGGGGGYFKLKDESWEEESGILTTHGLGALHVVDLVAAVDTLPLHTQLNIPEESLPQKIIEIYMHIAEENRKLYKPNKEYKDCSEIHEKLIQSLKINEAETLTLSNEEPEVEPSTKSAVDVALSLSEAFTPEPEDVDLNTLLEEPSISQNTNSSQDPGKIDDQSSVREPSPVKQPVHLNDSESPAEKVKVNKKKEQRTPQIAEKEQIIPQTAENEERAPQIAEKEQRIPKTAEKEQRITKIAEKEQIITKIAEKEQRITKTAEKEQRTPQTVADQSNKSNQKGPIGFDFGLSKVNTSVNAKHIKNTSKGMSSTSDVEPDPLKVEEVAKEEVKGPCIDLDAPVEQSKPVVITKSEEEDLEDWLDSVLDD